MNDVLGNPSLVVILGVLAPFVISLLKNPKWPDWAKHAVAIAVSVALGVAVLALRVEAGDAASWSVDTIVGHIATVLAIAYAVFQFLLKGGGSPAAALNKRLEDAGSGK